MTDDRASALNDLGERLATLGAVHHPAGARGSGEQLSQALVRGVPAHQALQEAGVSGRLARFVELAAPRNLPALLDGLAPLLSRCEARAGELRSQAAYAWMLAAASAIVGLLVVEGVVPAMTEVARASRDLVAPIPLPIAAPLAAQIVLTLALAGLGAVLWSRRPLFPFARARLRHERALVLGAAAAAARDGAELAVALRAGAALTVHPALAHDAEEFAASLARGAPQGGRLLFGELGAALFAAAATEGAGVDTLVALADFEEAAAAGEWTTEALKAELLSLALSGLAVGSAGLTFFLVYAAGML